MWVLAGTAAIAAIGFAFCPFVFAHTAHIQLLMTAGLPFSLLAFHRAADRPTVGRGAALGAVSDNGTVTQLGARALTHAREKMRMLEQDTRFRPEERQFLTDQWRRLRTETERATEELSAARKEFADLLRTLQANEDFVDELVQIRQAQKALEVIQRLTQDIRQANDQLKRLIGGIKPPGA